MGNNPSVASSSLILRILATLTIAQSEQFAMKLFTLSAGQLKGRFRDAGLIGTDLTRIPPKRFRRAGHVLVLNPPRLAIDRVVER